MQMDQSTKSNAW